MNNFNPIHESQKMEHGRTKRKGKVLPALGRAHKNRIRLDKDEMDPTVQAGWAGVSGKTTELRLRRTIRVGPEEANAGVG